MNGLTRAFVGLALVLTAGCAAASGGAPTKSYDDERAVVPTAASEVSDDHNETDLAYAHELSTQSQQAVDMVAMVANKAVSPELRLVAAEAGRTRVLEVERLSDMLEVWGVAPHGQDFHGNPGELTLEQLSELYALDDAAFEEAWVAHMVANLEGAVAMSRAEVDSGLNLEARELARQLVEAHESQISELERLAAESLSGG